jgi:hypothetical protein
MTDLNALAVGFFGGFASGVMLMVQLFPSSLF